MKFKNTFLIAISVCLIINNSIAQIPFLPKKISQKTWVDSVFQSLSTEERIGQLFMVAAYSGGKNFNETAIQKLINNHQIGGLIFMQGTPVSQAQLTNKFQSSAQVPLLISMDAEWGLGMRLEGIKDFPRQMMLGATRDTNLMYEMGMAVAYQCRRLGVHIDFAPVIDVNNNANNPVINSRSFGENKYWVAKMGSAYMRGLQENGVMACLKHFPGHGNTDVDSHKDLPMIKSSLVELRNLELYPFKKLIDEGAQSVMVAHLEVPALEKQAHVPTTLSKNTITNLLKNELKFKGLIFTDALNMNGVAKYFSPGEVDLKAFLAGNDVLLFSQDVPTAIKKIKEALENGTITKADLELRVKKILTAKFRYKLHEFQQINTSNIVEDINQYTLALRSKIAANAATIATDENKILSKLKMPNQKIRYVGVNASSSVLEKDLIKNYKGIISTWLPSNSPKSNADAIVSSLNNFDVNIIAIHNSSLYPGNHYGINSSLLQFLQRVQNNPKVIIVMMGNPYFLKNLCTTKSALVMYDDNDETQEIAAEILSGKIEPKGILPVSVCNKMTSRNDIITGSIFQPATKPTGPTIKNEAIVSPEALTKLNTFMESCIAQRAFPGARIVALQNGKEVLNQAYGFTEYQKKNLVDKNTVYDVASLTKVLSTTLAVMKLYEEKKINLDKKLRDYLPWVIGTDKANLSLRSLLLHQAGLKSWIPFYKETLDSQTGLPKNDLYSTIAKVGMTTAVGKNLYIRNDYVDTIWKRILDQPIETIGKYNYSDLDFYFMQKVVESITGKPLNVYVNNNFYLPMGLNNISYYPLQKFPLSQIAPTENDLIFRHQLVHGYVHDQGAAMMGGVAGHAGLFATADDVAAIFSMLEQNGMYNGVAYFKPETVKKFIAYNSFNSRRGLGFDKPKNERNDAGPTGERCSGFTFGHQGFTGTCAWADPENHIVFVLLCNRVNPNADNGLINKLSVRTVAQDYIYEALGIPENKTRPEVYQAQIKSVR